MVREEHYTQLNIQNDTHYFSTFLFWSVLTLQLGVHSALSRGFLSFNKGAPFLWHHITLFFGYHLTFGDHLLEALLLGYGHAHSLVLLRAFLLAWYINIKTRLNCHSTLYTYKHIRPEYNTYIYLHKHSQCLLDKPP